MDLSLDTLLARLPAARRPAGMARGLRLRPRTALGFHGRPGQVLRVDAGRIWLTEPGDEDDHFVLAGQRHVLVRGGAVVIECDGEDVAEVTLLPAG